jgi:ABC-type nickel/cobalt efflux system permease component RcnA
MVLALGVGLWALWQFVRAGRARDINSHDRARRPHARAAGIERQVWLLVPIFCGAFIVHAGTLYHSPLAGPPWYHRWDVGFLYETPGAMVLAVGVGLWALWQFVLAGRVERFDGHGGSGGHRPRAAGMGRQAWLLITIACAAFIVHAGTLYRAPDAGPFYETPGPMVLALGIGLWALWQFFRGGRAEDVKTTLPEIDPPRSSLDRDFEGS